MKEDKVRVIVSGDEGVLQRLQKDLAMVLVKHGLDVVELGDPKPGRNPEYRMMYITGKVRAVTVESCEMQYVAVDGGA
jgi:hypothetical protein